MKNFIRTLFFALALAFALTFDARFSIAFAQGTAFTYQGELQNNGSPAGGLFNMTFTLFTTSTSGSAVAGPVTNNAVNVTNGLFTVAIDFGSGPWTGASNWMEIAVKTNLAASFTTLAPRQQVTPAPYALYSIKAGTVSGVIPAASLPAAAVTNGESGVTLSNTTVSGNLVLSNAVFYTSNSAPFLTVDPQGDVLIGAPAGATNGRNVAVGAGAMQYNTNDFSLVAVGYQALQNDNAAYLNGLYYETGANTAVGYQALQMNTEGMYNTGLGYGAMLQNQAGFYNTALGAQAMQHAGSVDNNVAVGYGALNYLSGFGAGNVAIGAGALSTVPTFSGSLNTAIGNGAGFQYTNEENNNILINNGGTPGDSGAIRIGTQGTQTTTVIAGIYGGTFPGNVTTAPVVIDSNGHLISAQSLSYTPTIGDGTHNFNTTKNTGYYTKVGNLVYFEIWLQWNSTSGVPSGNSVQIGLPVAVTSAVTRVAFPLGFVNGVGFASQLSAGSNPTDNYINLYSVSNNQNTAPLNVPVSNCASSGEIQVSGWYRWQ